MVRRMANSVLQKTAAPDPAAGSALPKEVLNPLTAARQYTAHLYAPSAAVADLVEQYWVLRWDLRGKPAFTADVLPSPSVNLTFMREGARITGIATGKYAYELAEAGAIFGVTFRPGGFYPFWRRSVSALTDRAIPATDVFKTIDPAFNAALIAAPDDEDMIARVEALLVGCWPAADATVDLINRIIASISAEDAPTVRSLAHAFGISERSLQACFRTYVGVGLKWVMLRARLQKAAALAVQLASPNWAAVAADLGYTDQAHFVNDFRKIIGMPPAQYAALARSV